jgi:hypothetical protein
VSKLPSKGYIALKDLNAEFSILVGVDPKLLIEILKLLPEPIELTG